MSLRHDIILHPTVLGTFTLESLAEVTGMPQELLRLFVDHGLIEPVVRDQMELLFEAACVTRLRVIGRLSCAPSRLTHIAIPNHTTTNSTQPNSHNTWY